MISFEQTLGNIFVILQDHRRLLNPFEKHLERKVKLLPYVETYVCMTFMKSRL